MRTYGAHQRVENADSEGGPAGEGLGQVQLGVRVVVIVLVQELDVGVVHCWGHSEDEEGIHT